MARCILVAMVAAGVCPMAKAQAKATRTILYQGFRLPEVQGDLYYAISASEQATFGYNGSDQTLSSTTISGDLGYLSESDVHPFSMVYSGGYLANTTGQQSSSPFQNLAMTQGLNTRLWHLTLADSVSYLPYAPASGLSGIPGLGDLGVAPVPSDPGTSQGILSYAPRLSNTASGTVQRYLTGSTSVEGTGAFSILRFVGDSNSGGVESNQITGTGGVTHRIDALSNIGGNYTYSKFTYLAPEFSFVSQGVNLQYVRQVNRKLNVNLSVGPQLTTAPLIENASVNLAASLHMNYDGEFLRTSIGYTRSTNAGSGVITGGRSDDLEFSATRSADRLWSESLAVRYTHSTSLPSVSSFVFSSDVVVGSLQVSRQLGRSLSGFAAYTMERQAIQGAGAALNPFNGISQVLGVGLTYSPGPLHIGRQ